MIRTSNGRSLFVSARRSQSSWSCWYLSDGCCGRRTPSFHWLRACACASLFSSSARRPAILQLSAGVFAQLSFRNSFQLNEWSDLRVSCRPPTCYYRYSASGNVIAPQSARDSTAILDRRHEILDAILAARKQLTCSVESAVTETNAEASCHLGTWGTCPPPTRQYGDSGLWLIVYLYLGPKKTAVLNTLVTMTSDVENSKNYSVSYCHM